MHPRKLATYTVPLNCPVLLFCRKQTNDYYSSNIDFPDIHATSQFAAVAAFPNHAWKSMNYHKILVDLRQTSCQYNAVIQVVHHFDHSWGHHPYMTPDTPNLKPTNSMCATYNVQVLYATQEFTCTDTCKGCAE